MKDYPRLYGGPLTDPLDVKPLLRDPELHWKQGRSAYEVAHAWVQADGVPSRVSEMLARAPEWADAQLLSGFFEHSTALDTQVGPSCTDMLGIFRLNTGLGVIATEGKAGEAFGPLVSEWNNSPGKDARLTWACALYGVDRAVAAGLRWQLFHRTACAVLEAKRFHAAHAMMLVHDFGATPSWSEDYVAFARAISVPDAEVGAVSSPVMIDGVSLRLAWVRDTPC